MVEQSEPRTKDISINLYIKNLSIAVTEQLPVLVIWSRGNKRAQTKKRLLNENVHTAVIDEKFQITTAMEVDADGKPNKSKMSLLSVASDKAHGILGKAELDLSNYDENDFRILRLPLKDCQYEDAYIEVGLKGAPSAPKTPKAQNPAIESLNENSIQLMLEDLEKVAKEKKKIREEGEGKVKQLKDKMNRVQTDLENKKQDLQYKAEETEKLRNSSANFAGDHEVLVQENEANLELVKTAEAKLEEQQKKSEELDARIQSHQAVYDEEVGPIKEEVDEQELEVSYWKESMQQLYDPKRFNLNYWFDAASYHTEATQESEQGTATTN